MTTTTAAAYTVTKSEGATYLRSAHRWAKVVKVGSKWHYAGGWNSEIEADYFERHDCRTKAHAMVYARYWVEEG